MTFFKSNQTTSFSNQIFADALNSNQILRSNWLTMVFITFQTVETKIQNGEQSNEPKPSREFYSDKLIDACCDVESNSNSTKLQVYTSRKNQAHRPTSKSTYK